MVETVVPDSTKDKGNIPYHMMRRWGWKPGERLGRSKQNGLITPINARGQLPSDKEGLGYKVSYELMTNLLKPIRDKQVICWDSHTVFEDDEMRMRKADFYMENMRSEIRVGVCGLSVEALVDTGSDITCISESLFNQIKTKDLPIMPIKAIQIRGAVGKRSTKIQQIVSLNIELGTFNLNIAFLIVPNLIRPMILGFDFLVQHEVTLLLDSKHFGVYIERNKIQCFVPFISRQACLQVNNIESEKRDHISDITTGNAIRESELQRLKAILNKYPDVFSAKLGRTNCYEHKIVMQNDTMTLNRSYQIPYAYRERVAERLQEMVDQGIISRESTPYSSPLTFALKKDGSIRVLLDARGINKYMVAESEAPPLQNDILSAFHGVRFITTLDLNNAYYQIPINEEGRKYTGFTFNGKSYVYNVLPQGLKTSVGSFSRAMDKVLGSDVREFCVNYLDDLAIITKGKMEEHLEHIDRVLSKLSKAGLTCNVKKCEFICKEVKLLGFIVSTEGIRSDPGKIQAIQEFPPPRKVKHLRAFLGLCNFYRRFIPEYGAITIPLNDLLRKGRKWSWSDIEQKAFDSVKQRFLQTIELHHPDFSKPYYLQTDCSGVGLAGVLYQLDDVGEVKVLCFHSRALRGAELNWTVTEQEFFAVISCLKKFETYLRGNKVYIRTDHKALTFVKSWKLYNGRVTRWVSYLEQFDYEVEHIKGSENIVPDVLSRYPPDSIQIQEEKLLCPEICYMEKGSNVSLNKKLKNIIQFQREDSDIQELVKKISNGTDNQRNDRKASRCTVKHNVVLYSPKNMEHDVVYLPKALIEDLVHQVHLEMGHQGAYKCIKYIKDRFFWSELTKDVKRILRTCHICQMSKRNNVTHCGPCQSIVSKEVGEMVMIDIYGPLPKGVFGNAYILVVQDTFSKFVQLYPMRVASARAVVAKMKQFIEIIKPQVIMSDNGSQFTSRLYRDTMQRLGIRTVYTTVSNPRPNTTERVNKELGRIFRTFCHESHSSWAHILPKIEAMYNNTVHESTGYTPCEILYGERTKMSFDKTLPFEPSRLNVDIIKEKARQNLNRASESRKTGFNKRRRLIEFQIGDLVKVTKFNKSDASKKRIKKFELLYEGPYRIAAIPFTNVYTLACPRTGIIRGNFNTIHVSKYYI